MCFVPQNESAVCMLTVRIERVKRTVSPPHPPPPAHPDDTNRTNSLGRAGYRKTNLLRELLEAGADVLCLQEMQSDAYHQHFQPHLSEKGYDGLYKAKTREGAMGKVRLVWVL